MFSESEKKWIDEHQELIESDDYAKIYFEAEKIDKNFSSRLLLGILYLNPKRKFIIKVEHSPVNGYRLFLIHPDSTCIFIFTRISKRFGYE